MLSASWYVDAWNISICVRFGGHPLSVAKKRPPASEGEERDIQG